MTDMEKKDQGQTQHVDLPELESGKPKYAANTQLDDAARILAEAGHREFSAEDKKRVLRRIDFFVCLPMAIVYCVQQVCGEFGNQSCFRTLLNPN
jgi:hypothetical protein